MSDINTENLLEVKLRIDDFGGDSFLKIKETLTRMGISGKDDTLYQSAHILHKRGKYYIVHFKEMFALDGRATDITDSDYMRRNTIAHLLQDWELITILNEDLAKNKLPVKAIKILTYSEKADWILKSKYNIGKKKQETIIHA